VCIRKSLETYSEDMSRLAVSIMRFIAMGLGVEAQQYSETYREGDYNMRINCYPPCPEPERVSGLNPHTDINGITLLLECGDMAGLQVLKDGHWVFVEPINGALVVNLGHVMEVLYVFLHISIFKEERAFTYIWLSKFMLYFS
jgi:isopenicillin N synthase-like dioxygenase